MLLTHKDGYVPQLVKGGKYVFGWSCVDRGGRIVIPPEALEEYHLGDSERLILMSGSTTSGGFGIGSYAAIKKSRFGESWKADRQLEKLQEAEGIPYQRKGKWYCCVTLRKDSVIVPKAALAKYGVGMGDKLLVIRGSGLAIGFAVRGPIVEEARKQRVKLFNGQEIRR